MIGILLKTSVSLTIAVQIYFAFGLESLTFYKNQSCFDESSENKENLSVNYANDDSKETQFSYSKAQIFMPATLKTKLQREGNSSNINARPCGSNGSLKLHNTPFKYHQSSSLSNGIRSNGSKKKYTDNIQRVEPTRNFSDEIVPSFEIVLQCLAVVIGVFASYKALPTICHLFFCKDLTFFAVRQAMFHGGILRRKILPICFLFGLVNFIIFQVTLKLSLEVFLFACINNIVVLSACCLLLNNQPRFESSFENNRKRTRHEIRNYKRIENLDFRKSWPTLNSASSEGHKSISIVGISCRFGGGVNSKDAFWDLLVKGGCVIGEYPDNRLESLALKRFYNPSRQVPGKHYTMKGAFLDEIAGFDAQFFGISPAECRAMDPQQRLLLQSVYEAIEDAGLKLEDLQECRTGVYVGLMNLDYGRLLLDDGNVLNIDEFASTGITASTAANRISFSLNLNGPSLTVDTACSSSLSALNIAVTHLKSRECDVAVVCAPNLILARYFHTACCKTGLLADDGRCKSFDAKGDGYGRGEGMAVVILKPTHSAVLDKDDPYAQILSCGLNNDGQAAIPMTAPSDKMQAELAKRVLKESGRRKTDVQYVETHGTGTAVGDVVEMRSISDVYANTSSRILRIGSVKSNINHTESTAGLAGLIKVCLMIKNGYFVPTVNIQQLKPQLKIAERRMVVQTKLEPWFVADGKPKTAAVCSYGYGGANAHVIVQEVQSARSTVSSPRKRENWTLTLSARSREALRMMAGRFSDWLDGKPEDDFTLKENTCYTLNNRRSVHSYKLALSFSSFKQAANSLKHFSNDKPGWEKFIVVNNAPTLMKKLAFVYGGQGNCWFGMASELIQNEPKFCESIQQIDEILEELQVPWSLIETLQKFDQGGPQIEKNPIAQTALFGVHYAMTQLLKSWGITPSAVVGHSLGEISAACAAHVISLEEAVQLILFRAELQENCSSTGRMMAVGMSSEAVKEVIGSLTLVSNVSVAAVNSPVSVVLSGDQQSMQVVQCYLQRNHSDVFCKNLGTNRAFHSREMDCIENKFNTTIGTCRLKLNPGRAKIPFYSTVTGTQISHVSPSHWWNNIRKPVAFSSAIYDMISDGYKVFVEINVAPQFPRYIQEISAQLQSEMTSEQPMVTVVETLPKRSVKECYSSFLRNCPSTLFTRGFPIAWEKIQGSGTRTLIRCPSYPWQERKYWYREYEPPEHVGPLVSKIDLPASLDTPGKSSMGSSTPNEGLTHQLLGRAVATNAFSGLHAWSSEIDVFTLPYLKDHRFQTSEDAVIPGAVYIEMGLALALHMFPGVLPQLHDVTFENLLTLSTNEIARFCTRLDTKKPGAKHCYQITTAEGNGNEVLVSKGLVSFDDNFHYSEEVIHGELMCTKITNLKSRLVKQPLEVFNSERVNRRFAYGPQFSLIMETWCSETEALSSIVLSEEIHSSLATYVVHPAIIDACFQTLFILKNSVKKPVPYSAAEVKLHRRNFTEGMYCHVRSCIQDHVSNHVNSHVDEHVNNHVKDHLIESGSTQEQTCDIVLMDCHGNEILLIKKFKMVDLSNLKSRTTLLDVSYHVEWQRDALETGASIENKVWLIIPDHCGFSEKFTSVLPREDPRFVFEFPKKQSVSEGNSFSEVLEKALEDSRSRGHRKVCIVNFLPVDNRSLLPDWKNFDQAHYQAFESSLLMLQSILISEQSESIQFVMVTCESTSFGISHGDNYAFPWSSTLFGFRRTAAEELTSPKATIVDLAESPSATDFQLMVEDLQRAEIAEEIAYREGSRYLNQIKRLDSVRPQNDKQQSPSIFRKLLCSSTPVCVMASNSHNGAKNLFNETNSVDSAPSTISFDKENVLKGPKFSKLPFDPKCLKPDKSYLVAGGIRGFGFEMVRWLLKNGAKTVICTARSAPSESKIAEVTRLEQETGASILIRQADVTSWQDMSQVMNELAELPALAGIVFTAMVLEDQRIKSADLETCARVVRTKVQGSVVLHQLSLKFNLDFFIMFSSIAGIIGNVGQLAYSAGNTFLDCLCEYRHTKLGLPALSVAWGTMGGAGILERSKDIASLFQSYGFRMMACQQGLKFLEEFLNLHPHQWQIIICDIDWSTYLKSSAYILHRSPRLQSLNDETRLLSKPDDVTSGMTLEQLARLDPGQRRKIVEDFIRRLLSTWTEADCHEVDLNLALYKYGVDSIGAANMSLRIRNGVGAVFEIYYFIQPKTTGMSIINDTLEQVRNFERNKLNTVRMKNLAKSAGKLDRINKSQKDVHELKSQSDVKLVPLFVPDDAIVKVFMMHSSHKSAMANSPFASGFKNQEAVALYSIGTEDLVFESGDFGTVRNLATQYIKLIKSIQRTGPYFLAGFSFGGILSYEAACQLTQDGEDVAMVTMLDTMPWFPKSVQDNDPRFEKFQDHLIDDLGEKMVGRYLRSTALGQLGFTLAEFERLVDDLGPGEKLFSLLEERAKTLNVDLDDIRGHVRSLQNQSHRAWASHIQWQPPEVKYEQSVTYIRCSNVERTKESFAFWHPVASWESLTKNIDVITIPSSHFELLDQPFAEICGLVIMMTAVMKYRSLAEWQPGPSSNLEECLVNFLKNGVDVLIFHNNSEQDFFMARLWLDEKENELYIEQDRKKKIKLNDIHNILPGKYVANLVSRNEKQLDKDMIISLLVNSNQRFHIVCQDWRQRDYILDAFEVLFGIPFLRFDY